MGVVASGNAYIRGVRISCVPFLRPIGSKRPSAERGSKRPEVEREIRTNGFSEPTVAVRIAR